MEAQISISIPVNQLIKSIYTLYHWPETVAHTIKHGLIAGLNQQPKSLSKMSRDAVGYQWKNLFLPRETQIRMRYKGKYFYALVENDEIIYQGRVVTPGSFVKEIAKSSRNAWHDLWIKRPTDKEWESADEYRNGKNEEK